MCYKPPGTLVTLVRVGEPPVTQQNLVIGEDAATQATLVLLNFLTSDHGHDSLQAGSAWNHRGVLKVIL